MSVYNWALGDETKSILFGIIYRCFSQLLLSLKASSVEEHVINAVSLAL